MFEIVVGGCVYRCDVRIWSNISLLSGGIVCSSVGEDKLGIVS